MFAFCGDAEKGEASSRLVYGGLLEALRLLGLQLPARGKRAGDAARRSARHFRIIAFTAIGVFLFLRCLSALLYFFAAQTDVFLLILSVCQFVFSIFAFGGFIAIFNWQRTEFMGSFASRLDDATQLKDLKTDKRKAALRRRHLLWAIVVVAVLLSAATVEAFSIYRRGHVYDLEDDTSHCVLGEIAGCSTNSSDYRHFQATMKTVGDALLVPECALLLWQSVSIVFAIAFMVLSQNAIIYELRNFNREITKAAASAQLQHVDLFTNYACRHMDILALCGGLNETTGVFVSFTISMAAIMAAVCTLAFLHGLSMWCAWLVAPLFAVQAVLWVAHVCAISLSCSSMKFQIADTKGRVLNEKGIWQHITEKTFPVASGITARVDAFSHLAFYGTWNIDSGILKKVLVAVVITGAASLLFYALQVQHMSDVFVKAL